MGFDGRNRLHLRLAQNMLPKKPMNPLESNFEHRMKTIESVPAFIGAAQYT